MSATEQAAIGLEERILGWFISQPEKKGSYSDAYAKFVATEGLSAIQKYERTLSFGLAILALETTGKLVADTQNNWMLTASDVRK